MAQLSRISKNNTTIEHHEDGSVKRVVLYRTIVFEQGPIQDDGTRIFLVSHGGWPTVTTQARINQCLSESGIPLRISRAKGEFKLGPWAVGIGGLMVKRCLDANGDVTCRLVTDSFVVIN